MMSRIGKNFSLVKRITYSGKVSKLDFTAMVGQELWESSYKYNSVSNTNLPNDLVQNPALGTGTQTFTYGFGSSASVPSQALYGRHIKEYITVEFLACKLIRVAHSHSNGVGREAALAIYSPILRYLASVQTGRTLYSAPLSSSSIRCRCKVVQRK
mgnify:CR=1 FL=1